MAVDSEGFEIGADVVPEPEAEVVEAEAEASDVEEPENEAESSTADEEDVEEKTDSRFQKRIDELTTHYRQEQRAAEAARKEVETLRKQLEAVPKPSEPIKTLADFEFDHDKFAAYVITETERRATEAGERAAKGIQAKSAHETAVERFEARAAEFAKGVEDYEQVVKADDLMISTDMAAEIRLSEIGPEMAYFLGKKPDEAARIAKLQPREVIREMALLESRLLKEKSRAGKAVSNAPPPAAKIAAATAAQKVSTTDARSDGMSDEEWFKAEEKRTARK